MCHHHEGRDLEALRERLEAAQGDDGEAEPRLPPIPPS